MPKWRPPERRLVVPVRQSLTFGLLVAFASQTSVQLELHKRGAQSVTHVDRGRMVSAPDRRDIDCFTYSAGVVVCEVFTLVVRVSTVRSIGVLS